MITYLIIVNLLAGVVFAYDKHCARSRRWRVPEAMLHLLELLGGVPIVLILMYTIRHKNRKFSYFAITYLILALWIIAIIWLLREAMLVFSNIQVPPTA